MRSMVLQRPSSGPPWLRLEERETPAPGPGEVLLRVRVCGVCHTDLHEAIGEVPLPRLPVVPGHEIVGTVEAIGPGVAGVAVGDRVGVAWLAWTDGTCPACRGGHENLCRQARFTGYHRDGGYAEQVTADAAYVYAIPGELDDVAAAPLLCGGVIGYRALNLSLELRGSAKGARLGLYGFGASAHLVAQVALHRGCELHVVTRGEEHQRLALEMGAKSACGPEGRPPVPLDAAILFAPVGTLVPPTMEALADGGTCAIACLTVSPIPPLDYQKHLFRERVLRTVTAATRRDARELLAEAVRAGVRPHVERYRLEQANEALERVRTGAVEGAAVLEIG